MPATAGGLSDLEMPPPVEQKSLELDNTLPSFTPNPPVSELSAAVQQASRQGLPFVDLSK